MWEQTVFLKDVTHQSTMGGNPNAALGIDQHRSVDNDPPLFRAYQPGDHIDDRGLSGSRTAEQRGETGPAAKMDIETKGAEPVLDIDFQHRAHAQGCRAVSQMRRYPQSRTVSVWSSLKPG